MIALEVIQRIWTLIPSPNADGSVNLRELDEVKTLYGSPMLTIDGEGKRHLLISSPLNSSPIEDRSSAGVHLQCNYWGSTSQKKLYIDFTCLLPHLNDVFDLMVYDVLAEMSSTSEKPDRVCARVLNQWREMLIPEPTAAPNKTALVGVYGELFLLRQLTQINRTSIHAWTGPNKGRYDFYTGTQAVEVKTSLQRQGRIFTIHGHDQLEEPSNGQLYLMSFKVEEVPTNGETLLDLVNAIVRLGVGKFELYSFLIHLDIFQETLFQTTNLQLIVRESALYIVDDDFPRITTRSFAGERLPRGVIALSYQIDLSVPPPMPLDEQRAANVLRAFAESIR